MSKKNRLEIGRLLLNHKNFIYIFIFALVIRLFTFFVVFIGDSLYWVEMSSFLYRGVNPYETDVEFFYKYPPLFAEVLS